MNNLFLKRILSVSLMLVGLFSAPGPVDSKGSLADPNIYSNRQFGPGSLWTNNESTGEKVPKGVHKAWDRLKSNDSNSQAQITFHPTTGLPHSTAYLRVPTSGNTLEERAKNFLAEHHELYLKGRGLSDLILHQVRESPSGCSHVDFLQVFNGLRVIGAGLTVHFDQNENVVMVSGDYLPDIAQKNGDTPSGRLPAGEAWRTALSRLRGYPLRPLGDAELVIYAKYPGKGGYFLAYHYNLIGSFPGSHHVLIADAISGEPLAFFPTVAFLDGTASVFDPHAREPAPIERTITDLDDSGFLKGPLIVVLDEENERAQSAERRYIFDPETELFRQPSVYYYLIETRKRMRALGFDDSAAGALTAIVNARDKQTGGGFNNAFFNPLGRGFVFGNGDGFNTENMARDFDISAHEFGHFFDDFLINTEQTPLHTPRRAWGEAAGDTLAAIINGDPNIAESAIPGQPSMRIIENTKRFPNDLVNEEHADGEIFGGANWDFMKLVGGGAVTQAARDEMARVMIAGIPFIPMTNVQYSDILTAFIQGDMMRGGNSVGNLRQAYNLHGISEGGIQGKWIEQRNDSPRIEEKGLAGFLELQSNIPVAGTLPDGFFADFFIRVPEGATQLTVQTFPPRLPAFGDVVLRVAPSNFTGPSEIFFSDLGFIQETIIVTNDSPIPLSRDSVWLIEVADFFDGFFSEVGLVATIEGAEVPIQQIFFDQPVEGRIETRQDFDRFFFAGTGGQVIDISVTKRGDNTLDPLVALGNSAGQLLAFDDDGGGNQNALLSGFTLPFTDNYLVVVQSAITDLGPLTTGDYTLLLTTGSPPPPTPTPGPTPLPGEAIVLQDGVPFTGTIPGLNPGTNLAGASPPFKITVPQGARELFVRASESPTPGGNLIIQVRKGQPVGNTLDDFVGLGNRKSSVVVTDQSAPPLGPDDYFILVFNFAQTQQEFEIVAAIEQGTPTGMNFDQNMNGRIDGADLLALLASSPGDGDVFFEFAHAWSRP